jgi:putative sporulation protein YtxC
LLVIEFKDSHIGEAFYHQLKQSLAVTKRSNDDLIHIHFKEKETLTTLSIEGLNSLRREEQQAIISVLTNVTITHFFPKWLKEFLKDMFYYEDEQEIQAIIQTAKSLFFPSGGEEDRNFTMAFLQWQQDIFQKLAPFVENNISFSFDSFLFFRLKPSREKLLSLAELAIDEYKLELEYQLMLDRCRDFLKRQSPRVHTVYVFLKNGIEFYDSDMKKISVQQIYEWLETGTPFEKNLPVNERMIGPLVSMAPKKIIIDSAYCDNDLYHTLKNIFEERLFTSSMTFVQKQPSVKRSSFLS